jgi:hypothetical protein
MGSDGTRRQLPLRLGLPVISLLTAALLFGGCGGGGSSSAASTGGHSETSSHPRTGNASKPSAAGGEASSDSEGSSRLESSNQEPVSSSQSLSCPSTNDLGKAVELPVTWTLQVSDELAQGALPRGSIKSAYKRYCVYRSSDDNSFLYLVFADYPAQIASEEFAALQHHEAGCVEPSLCWRDNNLEETDPLAGTLEDPQSFVAWDTSAPPEGEEASFPFTSQIDAGAATEGTLCLLPLELPQRLAAYSEGELDIAFAGLQVFLREACGLSASAEEEPETEGSHEGSSLAGTTDDIPGAEQTYIAYTKALGEADYETACELLVTKYTETMPLPCPEFLDKKVFKGTKETPTQLKEDEQKASEETGLKIEEGELLWVGGEWLIDPEAVEEGDE